MIRVVRPSQPPAALSRDGAPLTTAMRRKYDRAGSKYATGERRFDFDASVYNSPSVKSALQTAQHHKCAFCEVRVGGGQSDHGTVDHYRPKGSTRQGRGDPELRPGYYWLAYAWENLLYVCSVCNESHKRTYFPLQDPSKRARSHAHDLAREKPLLIDPAAEDPEALIGWRDEVPFPKKDISRAKKTINVLNLDNHLVRRKGGRVRPREMHVETKREHLAVVARLANIELLARASTDPALVREGVEARALLDRFQRPTAQFAAMTRAFIAKLGAPR